MTSNSASYGVPLHWLNGDPPAATGTTWGVPWPRGAMTEPASLMVTTATGEAVPTQSWPLAYWPDGSLKWTAHAVPASAALDGEPWLGDGTRPQPEHPATATRDGGDIVLANDIIQVRLATAGPTAIREIDRGGRRTAYDGQFVLRLQDRPEQERTGARETAALGIIEQAEIEQSGPVRAVVQLSGHYRGPGVDGIFPWTARLYLYAGAESVRIVHSFVFDGDVATDFIRGLGLSVQVPLTDSAHDRHIRFAGADGGVWGEPVRVLSGLVRDHGAVARAAQLPVRTAQVDGVATPPESDWSAEVRAHFRDLPLWNDFTLAQNSANQFSVWKRTSAASSWLTHAGHGERAAGLGYVGGVSGGLAFGMRDFWQQFPRALDIRDAAADTATVTLWSWSPHAPVMDLRPYDDTGHGLALAYEDNRDGFGSAVGISRSTDMELFALPATPSRDRFADLAGLMSAPPQLVTTPAVYHAAGIFGQWSLPDRSTPARTALEDSIDSVVDFYAGQVEQRQWYGFWHYGDIMHTYDTDRHEWRYDVGGFAWDNAELGSDAMLWYAFLRTGDPRTFGLARAMTRHVSESDTYHAGRFAGLGSRHNVSHWDCGAKEARVGEAFTRRFMYYLTADELLGDWLHAALQADQTLLAFDPLRDMVPPQDKAPTRLRIGPDWYALVSNWLTEWERTGDVRWRDRIAAGMRDIASFPAGLFTGEAGGLVGFDPGTGHLTDLEKGDYHGDYKLAMAFCGDQIMFEAVDLIDVPEFRQALLDFARYCQAPAAEKIERYGFDFASDSSMSRTIYSRVTAWAGAQLDDAAIRRRGWELLAGDYPGHAWPTPVRIGGSAVLTPVEEIPFDGAAADDPSQRVSTNDAAQRSLAVIELLAIAPKEAP